VYRKIAALLLMALLAALCACGTEAGQKAAYAPQEERKLTIYTSHKEEIYEPIVREFEERTGIWVELVTGGTNELLGRISEEQEKPAADVMFGGGAESLEAYNGCFSAYASPELKHIDPALCTQSGSWLPFSRLPVVLIYNTKLVAADELQCWADLLGGRFRGNIAFANPALSGSCFTAAVTAAYALDGDFDNNLKQFSLELQGEQYDGSGTILDAVEDGRKAVGVTLEETARNYMGSSLNIGLVYPADGTSCLPDGVAVVKGCAHESNAQQFVDFVLGKDVQHLLERTLNRRSVRTDLKVENALPSLDTIPLVRYDVAWVCENRQRLLNDWTFWFGQEA